MTARARKLAVLLLKKCPPLYGVARLVYLMAYDHKFRHDRCWRVYAAASGKGLVYFIGNSHARVFTYQRGMIAQVISASTAHNLVKEDSTTGSRKSLFEGLAQVNQKRDAVVLVFGEVDCRFHIYNQFMKNGQATTMEELIDRTISNYGKVLVEIKQKGFRLYACSVVPASWRDHITAYPYYGTPEVRSTITRTFNQKLCIFCNDNGIPVIDVYGPAADDNGLIKPEYALDDIHLNEKIIPHVRMQLKETYKNWAA